MSSNDFFSNFGSKVSREGAVGVVLMPAARMADEA
jgi:hypothetical protein